MATLEIGETRRLKMHNKLLLDVIRRQAGTLDKAVLEGVMNGIEAGADKVDITFVAPVDEQPSRLLISDNGSGIGSLKEIEEFFETFGQPHRETENKVWAQFRMGRGQLFSFGRNIWRTGTFRMVVDIEGMGLNYSLETDLDPVEGCHITVELYRNPVEGYYCSLLSFRDSIQRQVEFMPGKITFNDKQLNRPPEGCKWTVEDENAYYLFGVGSELSVYNMGAFVKVVPLTISGVSGIVVSKKILQVNFARNDIQATCPVYGEIVDVVRAHRVKKFRKTGHRLTDAERVSALRDIRDKVQSYSSLSARKMFRTVQGTSFSLLDVKRLGVPWTVASSGDVVADRIMESGAAIVFDLSLFLDLSYPLTEMKWFFHWLLNATEEVFITDKMSEDSNYQLLSDEGSGHPGRRKAVACWNSIAELYREFEDISENYSRARVLVKLGDMTTEEKLACRLLETLCPMQGRKISVGVSESYQAWTDGRSYIHINRKLLKHVITSRTRSAIFDLFVVLQHELAHDDSTEETHVHGTEFYRNFHDTLLETGGGLFRFVNRYKSKLDQGIWRISHAKRKAKKRKEQTRRSKKLGLTPA